MVKLLIINVTLRVPKNRVNETITHVTLNTINGVVVIFYLSYVFRNQAQSGAC